MKKFASRFKVTSTGTSAASLTLGAATALNLRTLAQVITDGAADARAYKVGDTGVPLVVEERGTGNWEHSEFTLTSATLITRDRVVESSNGGNAVVFSGGPLTVFCDPFATWYSNLLSADDGATAADLPVATSMTDADSVLGYQGGAIKVIPATIAKTYYGASAAAVAPGQVTGLTAGAATDTTQVLNWTAPATGTAPFTYKVERSPAGANTWSTLNASVSGTTYTATGATASTSYDYRVSATNTAGTGPVSSTLTASTTAAATVAPGQVTGLTAGTAADTTQALTWTAVSGATSYTVERSPAGANNWTVAATGVTGTSYTVTGLTPSTSYDYRVKAVNTAGSGTVSATVTKATIATPVAPTLSNPVGTATGANTATATVSTDQGNGTLYYMVSQNATESAATVKAGASKAVTATGMQSVSFTGLIASTQYYSHFVHVNATGQESAVANGPGFTTPAAAAPTGTLSVNAPGNQVAGMPWTVSGTWTGTQPTAIDYLITDNGTPNGTWRTDATNVVINANGTLSINVTPSTTSTSRTITIRDRNSPQNVSAASTAYSVHSASSYDMLNNNASEGPAAMTGTYPNQKASQSFRVTIRPKAGTNAPMIVNRSVQICWGKEGSPSPLSYSGTSIAANSPNGNDTASGSTGLAVTTSLDGVSTWNGSSNTTTNPYYGLFTTYTTFNAYGTPGRYNLFLRWPNGDIEKLKNADGSDFVWTLT